MPSNGSVKRKLRLLKARSTRMRSKTLNKYILDPYEPLPPIAVGGQGKGSNIYWADFPVHFYSVETRNVAAGNGISGEAQNTPTNSWTNSLNAITIVSDAVQLHVNSSNKNSLCRKILANDSRASLIKAARETPAPKFGLVGENKKWLTMQHCIEQTRFPWTPELLRRNNHDEAKAELENDIHRIGNAGAKKSIPGLLMILLSVLLACSYLMFTVCRLITQLYFERVGRASFIWGLLTNLVAGLSVLLCGGGLLIISVRKSKTLNVMKEICEEKVKLWREEDVENDIVRRIDVLVSEEQYGGSFVTTNGGIGLLAETVYAWIPITKPNATSKWSSLCQPRKRRMYFLRYSEYPKTYQTFFRRHLLASPDEIPDQNGNNNNTNIHYNKYDDSDYFDSSSSMSFSEDNNEVFMHAGIVCNPYILGRVAKTSLIQHQYQHYFSHERSESTASNSVGNNVTASTAGVGSNSATSSSIGRSAYTAPFGCSISGNTGNSSTTHIAQQKENYTSGTMNTNTIVANEAKSLYNSTYKSNIELSKAEH